MNLTAAALLHKLATLLQSAVSCCTQPKPFSQGWSTKHDFQNCVFDRMFLVAAGKQQWFGPSRLQYGF
jgi:hypothetical protein